MDGEERAQQEPEDALDEVVDDDRPGPEGHVGDVGDPGGEVHVHEPLRRLLGLPEGQVSQCVGHDEVAVEVARVRKDQKDQIFLYTKLVQICTDSEREESGVHRLAVCNDFTEVKSVLEMFQMN